MQGSIDRLYGMLDCYPWVKSVSITAYNPGVGEGLDKQWYTIFIHFDDTCESFHSVDNAVAWIKLKDYERTR